jgi:HK97 gp10 family phage protein
MAGIITARIVGGADLQRKLERFSLQVAKGFVRRGLRAGANVFKELMVQLAPRDTGFLAEHFGVKISAKGKEISGSAYVGPQGKIYYPGREPGKSKKGMARAVATVARFLEFGTSRMAPRAFMTQAFENGKNLALNNIIETLKRILSEEAR